MAQFGRGGCIICLTRKDTTVVKMLTGIATPTPKTIDAPCCARCAKMILDEQKAK